MDPDTREAFVFRRRLLPLMVAVAVLAAAGAAVAGSGGFQTSDPALITLNVGGTVMPIISSGEEVDGVTFEGLPDGIGLVPTGDKCRDDQGKDDDDDEGKDDDDNDDKGKDDDDNDDKGKDKDDDDDRGHRGGDKRKGKDDAKRKGKDDGKQARNLSNRNDDDDDDDDDDGKKRDGCRSNEVDVYVAHEQTTIPFPPAGQTGAAADYIDSSVTRWTLDTTTGKVLHAKVAISSDDGFKRFCSAAAAGPNEGFTSFMIFANEETNDIVDVPAGAPYGPDPALTPKRQGGYTVALDTKTGTVTPIPGMGRLNHENTIALPGYKELALLTTDDTFTATTSQLYMYIVGNQKKMLADEGDLYAFQVTHKNGAKVNESDPFNKANDYLDLGLDDEMQGRFIKVPKEIARGTTGVAPQDALEQWSIDNNVFTFVRLEDVAVDKNNERVVYVADTGASRVVPNDATGRIHRPAGTGKADNGRIFRFVFDKKDPKEVDSFTVLADGDNPGHSKYVAFTSPDNIDTSKKSLMVQEDADNAQIWQHTFSSGSWTAVANVVDVKGESSGIVDASRWFGPGAWILDVQAHGLPPVASTPGPGYLIRREDGQLLLMKIPGS